MKIIPKFQQGGAFSNRFVDYLILLGPGSIFGSEDSSSKSRKSSSEDSEKGKLTEKDLFNLFSNFDGLPSDVDAIIGMTKRLYDRVSLSSSDSFNSSGLVNISTKRDLALAYAKFNKQMYDSAFLKLQSSGGLNEVAILNGNVVVYSSEGKLTNISPSEYLSNKDKYHAVSNSDLLWLRAYKKEYANDNSIIKIANNGIGMEDVAKMVQERIGNLGSDKQSQETYQAGIGTLIVKGLELLQNADIAEDVSRNGMTGIYKVKSLSESLQRQIKSALNYIYKTLTPEAQALLQVKGGDSKNPVQGALNIIAEKLISQSSETQSYSIDYQDKFDEVGNIRTKEKSGEKEELKENAAMAALMGRGLRTQVTLIPGDNIGFKVSGNMINLTGSDNKSWKGKYLDELRESGFAPILDMTNATMGNGRRVIMPDLVEITDPHARFILFPAKADGTPDLSQENIDKKREADRILKEMGIDVNNDEKYAENYATINRVYAEMGFANGNNLKKFAIVDAMTNNKALGMDDAFESDEFMESVSDSEFEAYEKRWNLEHSKNGNKVKLGLDPQDAWIFEGDHDEVYKGLLWIPVFNSYINALIGTGETIKPSIAQDADIREFVSLHDELAHRRYVKPNDDE